MYYNLSLGKEVPFEELMGKTLKEINGATHESEEVEFITVDDEKYIMYHEQDCCVSVYLEDVIGSVECLIGTPITMAELVTEEGKMRWDTYTWSFYKLATVKGYVTLRWYGESNGFYSETVEFVKSNKRGE